MKMGIVAALGLLLSFAESPACAQSDKAQTATALVGGTLIDVANFGHSPHDIPNAVVILRAGKIEAAGPAALVKVPRGARTMDSTAPIFCQDWWKRWRPRPATTPNSLDGMNLGWWKREGGRTC